MEGVKLSSEINILITGVGRRTILLDYFKRELKSKGNVIAADCSSLAPALYKADKHFIVPRVEEPDYIDAIKEICRKERITCIISLIDYELLVLSEQSRDFENMGVTVLVSPLHACKLWTDKYEAYKFCQRNGFKCAITFKSFQEFQKAYQKKAIQFPVFIKPVNGSASLNIHVARNINEAKVIFKSSRDMIIQEFLDGDELGVDVYVDIISKEVVSIFIKEKLEMRAGETDKAKSIHSEKLSKIIEELVTSAGLVGPIDIDVFAIQGEYYISEINPRFGGGYPLAFECGVNFPQYIINNLQGIVNTSQIGNYPANTYMLKHDMLAIQRFVK